MSIVKQKHRIIIDIFWVSVMHSYPPESDADI